MYTPGSNSTGRTDIQSEHAFLVNAMFRTFTFAFVYRSNRTEPDYNIIPVMEHHQLVQTNMKTSN